MPQLRSPTSKSGRKATPDDIADGRAARVIQSGWGARRAPMLELYHMSGAREFARVARTVLAMTRIAVRIQRHFRGTRIRRTVAEAIELGLRRKARAKARLDTMYRLLRRDEMARKIQGYVRKMALLREVQRSLLAANERYFDEMKRELQQHAAVTIQTYARGMYARRVLAKKQRVVRVHAATKIQSHARRRATSTRVQQVIRARSKRLRSGPKGGLRTGGALRSTTPRSSSARTSNA
jgi:hypothetical protein